MCNSMDRIVPLNDGRNIHKKETVNCLTRIFPGNLLHRVFKCFGCAVFILLMENKLFDTSQWSGIARSLMWFLKFSSGSAKAPFESKRGCEKRKTLPARQPSSRGPCQMCPHQPKWMSSQPLGP